MSDLTPKQEKFANEYIDTGNGTHSALKAYDTEDEHVAASIASENLRKPDVRAYIESKAEKAAEIVYTLAISAENETVRLNASKDILDRAGHKPIEKQDITSAGKPIPIINALPANNSNSENTEAQ